MEAAPCLHPSPAPPPTRSSPSSAHTFPLHSLARRVVARRRSPSCNLRGCHIPRLRRRSGGWSPAAFGPLPAAHSPHTALVLEESLHIQDHGLMKDEAWWVSSGIVQEALSDAHVIGGLRLSAAEGTLGSEDAATTWVPEDRFLQCCEPGKKLRVAVLLSGGVDSSVALRLLCAAGHSCTAFYLKIWFQDNFENFWSSCPWEEDLKYAQEVCDQVEVELKVVHLTYEYWNKVVSETIDKYQAGLTPNPDILCNSRIKFGAFLDHIHLEEFDRIASGHYARVERVVDTNGKTQTSLHLSLDELKDQTYFLSHLSQAQLSWLTLPLGCICKAEVRLLATAMGLPNRDRKDSQGICFLGKVKFSDFIARHIGEKEGRILEAETGQYLGMHKGFWFFTIGQRQGLGLSNGPWFVVEKDMKHNVVFVSRTYHSIEKERRIFQVNSINWFSGSPPHPLEKLRCKVRHGPNLYDCKFELNLSSNLTEGNNQSAVVTLSEDDQGLAAGQYAAFYCADMCLGSGIITENPNTNVSSEALLLASSNVGLLRDKKFPVMSRNRNVSHNKLKSTLSSSETSATNSLKDDGISKGKTSNEHNLFSYVRWPVIKIFEYVHLLKENLKKSFTID